MATDRYRHTYPSFAYTDTDRHRQAQTDTDRQRLTETHMKQEETGRLTGVILKTNNMRKRQIAVRQKTDIRQRGNRQDTDRRQT